MKASTIIACLIIFCCIKSTIAQDTIKRKMINSTSVTLISDPSFHYSGALYQVNNSSLMVSNSTKLQAYKKGRFSVSEIDILDIQVVKISSRIKARNGALIGAASGFILGGMIGFLSDPGYFSNSETALASGIVMMPIGAFAGAIIGSFSIKIPINGSLNNYNRNKATLIKYSLKK